MATPRLPSNMFNPTQYGLDKDFQLTLFSDLDFGFTNVSIKEDLNKLLLDELEEPEGEKTAEEMMLQQPKLRVGSNRLVIPLQHGGLYLLETTEFAYPVVDDPYVMGQIACADVLSNLYALGIMEFSNMLMLLAVPQTFTNKQREVVIPLMMRGFKDIAKLAGTKVRGAQTVINPWCTIGGTVTSVCTIDKFICQNNVVPGDVLVLTKPLGTQVALLARKWLTVPEKKKKLNAFITTEDVERAYQAAVFNMCKLNEKAASRMAKYNAHGAVSVSGLGILGHAELLARCQKEEVKFVIHNLPIIANMLDVAQQCMDFMMRQGRSPEVSGGLLIALPREEAGSFCKEMEQQGTNSWIIGFVDKGNRSARVIDRPRIIQVTTKILW